LIAYTQVPVTATNASPLKAGMTTSNEPGYYADGKFGIRIESVVLVCEVTTPNNFGDKGFLGFENITMYVFFSIPFAFPPSKKNCTQSFFFLMHYNF
jgi:Xaa-Pro aminopeptidase